MNELKESHLMRLSPARSMRGIVVFICLATTSDCNSVQYPSDPKFLKAEQLPAACAARDLPRVALLVTQGISVDFQNFQFGNTCMHYAAYSGHLEMVDFLLQHGASVKIRNKRFETVLFSSVYVPRNNKPSDWDSRVINRILQSGGKEIVNWPDENGITPLYWACRLHDPHVVQLLLENGADPKYAQNGTWALSCVQRRLESGNEAERLKGREIWSLLRSYGAPGPDRI
jgi:hypothetical protein